MVETNVSPQISEKPELLRLVGTVAPLLVEAIGQTSSHVIADWETVNETPLRLLVNLRMKYPPVEVATSFAPDELQPSDQIRRRFASLWDDLLRIAIRKQLEKLETAEIS